MAITPPFAKGGVTKVSMHFVYLLQSDRDQTFYIGRTVNIEKRLAEHNAGRSYFTNRKRPWKMVYYESYRNEELAKERERQLKRFGSAYMGLLKRLDLK